jgi:trans-2-enoyl-CoA reductase
MTPRARVLAYGSAAVVVLVGAAIGFGVSGAAGQVAGISVVTIGFGAALLLVFYEVGLSEDRERAAGKEQRRKRAPRHVEPRRTWLTRRPRRPG